MRVEMKIGNLDEPNNTDGLAELIKADHSSHMTKAQRRKNWWYYYKWYVIIGVILSAALIHLVGNALRLFTKSPDLQIAYVGAGRLPDDTAAALEQIFGSLIADYNQDGEILVQINQYIRDDNAADAETAYAQYASEVSLLGDISGCESYLFLMDDPEHFQQEFQVLAMPDGSCPGDADYSIDGKVIPWTDCPLLSRADASYYTELIDGQSVTGTNQDLLADLYLGRRYFYNDRTTENREGCDSLWELLCNSLN